MLKLPGIFAPLTTPFDHNGDVYKTKIRHNVEKWNLVKLTGYVVGGSTGEGVHLSADEQAEVWSLAAEPTASGRLLLAGMGAQGVRESVALANKAAELGYAAAVAVTPHFYRPLVNNAEAQELYFTALADRAKIPVIIENIPQFTGIDIPAESVARLSHHPNIIGIRECSGVLGKINWMLREVKKGFQILAGSEATLWTALDLGATGAIVDFANPAPYACITIWEAHRMREREAAQDWQNRITHPAELVTARYGLAGLKYAMDLNGYYGGPCRLPLRPITTEAKAEIEAAFDGIRG